MNWLGPIITLLALNVVIFLHELGHMLAARRAGIGVYEFSVGMGPKILSKRFRHTLYAIRLFPLGGFVKLAGLDEEEDGKVRQKSEKTWPGFHEKSLWQKFLTLVAGSGMNILTGFILFAVIFAVFGAMELTPVIQTVLPNTPAAQARLQGGDRIMAVNGVKINDPMPDIIEKIHASKGNPLTLQIQTLQNEVREVKVTPIPHDGQPVHVIGIQLTPQTVRYSIPKAIEKGVQVTAVNVKMVFLNLKMLITGKASLKEMAGPVGIVQFASYKLNQGVMPFLALIGMISITLGVINLLPFPVLDGGHILLLFIEGIRGKRLNQTWETRINQAGMAVLIFLMVLVLWNDVINWSARKQLLNEKTTEKAK